MNANELADELDWMTPEKLVGWCNSVQAMLRQQQAEIEALKAKTLTAEEINQVAKDCKWDYDEMNVVDFARAILRKAQEK